MYFLVNVSPPKRLDIATSNILCDLDAKVKVDPSQGQGQILNFLVNAFPKPFDLATSNFVAE